MLNFLFSVLRLIALAVCLVALRAASLDQFIIGRIAKARGREYLRNNMRKNNLENYIYFGFKDILPAWLYYFNLGFTALSAAVFVFMFIGFAFGAVWLVKFALWLFMYIALTALITNLLYNIPAQRVVRKWSSIGLYGASVVTLPLTAILWSICF